MSRLVVTFEDTNELALLQLEPLLEQARQSNRHIVMSIKDEATNKTETYYPRVVEVGEVTT